MSQPPTLILRYIDLDGDAARLLNSPTVAVMVPNSATARGTLYFEHGTEADVRVPLTPAEMSLLAQLTASLQARAVHDLTATIR